MGDGSCFICLEKEPSWFPSGLWNPLVLRRPLTACSLVSSSECVRLKPSDISRTSSAISCTSCTQGRWRRSWSARCGWSRASSSCCAYPLIQEASLASQEPFLIPTQVFPPSSLYGIPDRRSPAKTSHQDRLGAWETCPGAAAARQPDEPGAGARGLQLSQLPLQPEPGRPDTHDPLRPAADLAHRLTSSPPVSSPTPGEDLPWKPPRRTSSPRPSPSPMLSRASWRGAAASPSTTHHLCGAALHAAGQPAGAPPDSHGGPFPTASQPGEAALSLCSNGGPRQGCHGSARGGHHQWQWASAHLRLAHHDGQPHSETPPPSDIADIDNLEQADQEAGGQRAEYGCTICGRSSSRKATGGSTCTSTPGSLSNAAHATRASAGPTRQPATCASTRASTPTPWWTNRLWSSAPLRKAARWTTCWYRRTNPTNATCVTKRSHSQRSG